MQTIRVIHVIRQMNRGGAEAMIMNIYRNIDRTKVQFDFLVHTNEKGLFDEEIKALGGRIFRIGEFTGMNFISYYNSCLNFFHNHSECKIVHGHLGSSAPIYLAAAKKCGLFTIAHSHDAVPMNSLRRILFQLYAFPVKYVADYFFGCSTEAGISRFGEKIVCGDKYKNYYNAIDLNQFQYNKLAREKIRNEFGIKKDRILIGTVGRITSQKNPELIYKIFISLISSFKNVQCLWVGTGDLEKKYIRLIKSNNINNIIMTGIRSDVPDIMSALDCFILPSQFEGLPVVAVEAQATGLKCVLSDKITREVEITQNISWLSINSSAEEWARKAYQLSLSYNGERSSQSQSAKSKGYDINDTSKWLCKFYEMHTHTIN